MWYGGSCSPYSGMWCLSNFEQTRNIRVIVLARIRPEEGDKLGAGQEAANLQGDSRLAVREDGGGASAYLLRQLFLWIGPRVFAYGHPRIR